MTVQNRYLHNLDVNTLSLGLLVPPPPAPVSVGVVEPAAGLLQPPVAIQVAVVHGGELLLLEGPGVGAVPAGGGGADDAVAAVAERVEHPHGRHLDADFVLGELQE